jgi:transcription-repair coupling factor (superfamily II helicase)
MKDRRPPPPGRALLDNLSCRLDETGSASIAALPPAASAYLARRARECRGRPQLWVFDGSRTMEEFARDAEALCRESSLTIRLFPQREDPDREPHRRSGILGDRLLTLYDLAGGRMPDVLATDVQALLQPVLSPASFRERTHALHTGGQADPESFRADLDRAGYEWVPTVQGKGEASVHGGICDVWPPHADWPTRIEFFDTIVESIRLFDPATQRSRERRPEALILPAGDWPAEDGPRQILDWLPAAVDVFLNDPAALEEHAALFQASDAGDRLADASWADLRREIETAPEASVVLLDPDLGPADARSALVDIEPLEERPRLPASLLSPDRAEQHRMELLTRWEREEPPVHIRVHLSSEGSLRRFREWLRQAGFSEAQLDLRTGALSGGFYCPADRLAVLSENDLYGVRRERRGRYEKAAARRSRGPRIEEWTDIQPGDLVVHVEHGIGRYLGLYEVEFQTRSGEALAVEYAEGARLFVPVDQAHLLSRYVQVGARRTELHRLGGRRWKREKSAAETAIRDLAGSLLRTQAARESNPGRAFQPDTLWQAEFEAAFPYEETPDQARAIEEIKRDMERARPMDRLLCGDVGYGKTEVAMRAAFKTVMDGAQVALLVPTTILAQQHFETFRERMAAYPFRIECLSRFRTRAEQARVVRELKGGAVDIVIGTHRLVQADIGFRDLGLIIIDEEQRFGVEDKERLKQIRETVDVLTMTATPIPRTLYLSLTGARDISTIQTPPRERMPVKTLVRDADDHVFREAILREINREGQAFILHNRVATIHALQRRLSRAVPEARIAVAHGQMHERDLEEVMNRFLRGDFDVLLCTTIIESGVDIPSVNTILIDRADRFGLADLYQLRGRVGRTNRQAYAYLLIPPHIRLEGEPRKRIRAIQQHTRLGSGFQLALRDLEIRGAGNLLGAAQSGHIAAVGFELYCQLLKRTVCAIKGETPPPVVEVDLVLDFVEPSPGAAEEDHAVAIPYTYMEDETERLTLYRRLAAATSIEEIEEWRIECRDRFGPLPAPAERCAALAELRVLAARAGLQRIETRGAKVLLMRGGEYVQFEGRHPVMRESETTARIRELSALARSIAPPETWRSGRGP